MVLFNPLNAELNPICHLLALLGVHHFLHVSRIRFNSFFDSVIAAILICFLFNTLSSSSALWAIPLTFQVRILNNTFKPTLVQKFSRIQVYKVLALLMFFIGKRNLDPYKKG